MTHFTATGHHPAEDWLATCLAEHDLCSIGLSASKPRRLLKIGSGEDGTEVANLVEYDKSTEHYATLSYCWGQNDNFKLTVATEDALRRGIAPSDLPATIRDAIKVTKMLGLTYLWVDALCIRQDSASDWEDQSSKMAGIYEGCTIMIAPTQAADCSHGFLSRRQPSLEFRSTSLPCAKHIQHPAASTIVHIRSRPRCHDTASTAKSNSYHAADFNSTIYPLFTRAWCFQEHALAPRVLYVDKTEFSYSCRRGRICECNGPENWTLGGFDDIHQVSKASIQELRMASHFGQDLSADDVLRKWQDTTVQYSGRQLSFHRDKLTALSAIADIIPRGVLGDYVAGLWSYRLIDQLCWCIFGNRTPRPEGNSAPSFSWASTVGVIWWLVSREDGDDCYYSTVTGWSAVAGGLNPFGEVERASVRMSGPLITARVVETGVDRKMRLHVVSPSGLQLDFYKDCFGEIVDGARTVMVPIRRAGRYFLFLVLVPVPSVIEINTFRRVGIADLGSSTDRQWLEGLERTEITIV